VALRRWVSDKMIAGILTVYERSITDLPLQSIMNREKGGVKKIEKGRSVVWSSGGICQHHATYEYHRGLMTEFDGKGGKDI
jgi:hypothetical protein